MSLAAALQRKEDQLALLLQNGHIAYVAVIATVVSAGERHLAA